MSAAAGSGRTEPEIVLDLSRLLSRVLHSTPTGVDRVEMAYAHQLLGTVPDRLSFGAVHPLWGYGRLPRDPVLRFLDATQRRWEFEGRTSELALRRSALHALRMLRPRRVPRAPDGARRIYVQTSPHHLDRAAYTASILRRERARFVCLVHDLIPLQYPEYARPDGAAQHAARISTVVGLADGIVANSHATMASLMPWIEGSGRRPALAVAHLGTTPFQPIAAGGTDARPYFISIGTIEPRKNHLLLLNIWRNLSERLGADTIPKLVLIGRRGWENEQVVDMLERCPALAGCVEEHGGLADREVRGLLAGAKALLLPSFAEGYGMPVTEALEAGVPVVCSDLAALREAGGAVPEFINALDGPEWTRVILDLAQPGSIVAQRQRERLADWRPSRWPEHIALLLELLHRVAA